MTRPVGITPTPKRPVSASRAGPRPAHGPERPRCTQDFGGPQSATVAGIWHGQAINTRFNLKNGCEIARWKALTGLLPGRDRLTRHPYPYFPCWTETDDDLPKKSRAN